MKNLLYILPIIILFISCSDDTTNVEQDERFKTVYGMERTLEDATIAGVVGDTSKNPCSQSAKLNLITYPNPAHSGVTLSLRSKSELSFEIFIETAINGEGFIDSLNSLEIPNQLYITQHKSYFKKSIYKGEIRVGQSEIMLDLNQIDTGLYFLTYEDSEGKSDCTPLVVQRYTR